MGPRFGRPRLNLLELGLAAGALGVVLGALPLGLPTADDGVWAEAGLALRTTVDPAVPDVPACPPLVMLLLRVFAWLPIGDLATRMNAAAAAAAAVAAVLLGRLVTRVLRDLHEGRGARSPLASPAFDPGAQAANDDTTLVPVPAAQRSVGDDTMAEATGSFAPALAAGASLATGSFAPAFAGPRIFGPKGVVVDAAAAGPAPRRRTAEVPSVSSRAVTAEATGRMRAVATRDRKGRLAAGADPVVVGPLRGQVRLPTHQAFALLGGVAAPLLSVAVFVALTSSPAAAVTLALVVGVWLRLLAFERSPGTPRRALALALLAGLALGVDPVAVVFVWPPVALCGLRWFRRGERWPLLAPLAFIAGAMVALPAVVRVGDDAAAGGVTLRSHALVVLELATRVWTQTPSLQAIANTAVDSVNQLGVLAALLGLVGVSVLLTHRPRLFAFLVTAVALALALLALRGAAVDAPVAYGVGRGYGAGAAVWAILLALAVVPIAIGVAHLSAKLGPARDAAALVLAVTVAVWPAFDGGTWRFARPTDLHEALLSGIEGRIPVGAAVAPGTPTAAALLRYGQAMGRRPDVVLSGAKIAP